MLIRKYKVIINMNEVLGFLGHLIIGLGSLFYLNSIEYVFLGLGHLYLTFEFLVNYCTGKTYKFLGIVGHLLILIYTSIFLDEGKWIPYLVGNIGIIFILFRYFFQSKELSIGAFSLLSYFYFRLFINNHMRSVKYGFLLLGIFYVSLLLDALGNYKINLF
jgi:hypothetical protein